VEVVHAHQYTPFFYAALAKMLCRGCFRLILTEHGRHYPDLVSRRRRWINRLLLAGRADAVNACSRFSADALARLDGFPARRIEVIENGVTLDLYRPAADRRAAKRDLGLDPDRRYVALIGRFHPVKDHATMLAAFREVARSRRDVDLLLVGDGPLRGDAEGRAADLGIAGRVRFLGVRRDVPEILGAIDVFALTSLSEAASLTLLEAMASALPVVVTAVGGNPEIVRDGVEGLLAPRGDADRITAAIGALLDDPERASGMGRAGRATVAERYDLERTIARYHALYERLSGRSPAAAPHGTAS
jgi:glycosyltransferase involved in cell wall biosynthesis